MYNPDIEPSCGYCRNGEYLGKDEIACKKRGIVEISGYCGSFRYEPTKRTPHNSPRLKVSGFTEDDFSLTDEEEDGRDESQDK